MQIYVDIDVYGECGKLKCDLDSFKCTDFEKTYRFYLAFENSLCLDYVTEKVFKVMDQIVIPIVYNGADMKRILPPKSVCFIHNLNWIVLMINSIFSTLMSTTSNQWRIWQITWNFYPKILKSMWSIFGGKNIIKSQAWTRYVKFARGFTNLENLIIKLVWLESFLIRTIAWEK